MDTVSTNTVTVACKLPNGLILHLDKRESYNEPVMGGGTRKTSRAVRMEGTVTLNGYAHKFGEMPAFVIAGGFALTPNVPEEFWDEWLKQNGESDLVKNGLIFARAKADVAGDEAKEKQDLASGLQPLRPGPRGTDGRIDAISRVVEVIKAA
jgi:hypothetical protein